MLQPIGMYGFIHLSLAILGIHEKQKNVSLSQLWILHKHELADSHVMTSYWVGWLSNLFSANDVITSNIADNLQKQQH